jgi:hypothetical protein
MTSGTRSCAVTWAESRPPTALIVLALAAAVLAVACGGSGQGSTGVSDHPAGAGSVAGHPTGSGQPTGASSSAPDSIGSSLIVDPSLLAILPTSVDGVALVPAPETAARMIGDQDLKASASAIAVGMAAQPAASNGSDLVVATVVKLRPGTFTESFYDGWRAAYDEAACDPAGGVTGHDRQSIGGRAVDIATCGGGARTYHVHLDGDILVSVTAVGEHRFGDQLMAGLRQ